MAECPLIAVVKDDAAIRAAIAKVEHERVLQVLRDTNGVIGGTQGAAARFGLRRTTLLYRLEKLGVSRQPS